MIAIVKLRVFFFILLSLSFMLSGNVQAKPEHGKKFKDWTMVCEKLPKLDKEICGILQTVTNENRQILQVSIGYLPNSKTPRVILTLAMPLGVFLEPGLEFKGGNAKPVHLPFKVCHTNACVATIILDKDIIKNMKAGTKGSVKFAASKDQVIEIPISLSGFTAAFNSLK